MRLCVPTESEEGLLARVSDRFGRAPAFTVIDTTRELVEAFRNPERSHEHGRCAVATYLADCHVDAVACREIGRNVLASLRALQIDVYATAGATVNDVLEAARDSSLQPVGDPDR